MKNILITLGCSFTQGDGCWDESLLESKYNGKKFNELNDYELSMYHNENMDRFLQRGWPSKLQEMLKYDELYNLGFGGASNQQLIRMFMEDIYYKDFSDSNVLVIQLLTFSDRIGFYSDGVSTTFPSGTKVYQEYIKSIKIDINGTIDDDDDFFVDDSTLEMYFNMKIMKELCENKGWNFLFGSIRGNEKYHLDGYLDRHKINSNFINLSDSENNSIVNHPSEYTSICGHPNEDWYKIMAERMYNLIIENENNIPIGNSNTFIKNRVRPKKYIKNPI